MLRSGCYRIRVHRNHHLLPDGTISPLINAFWNQSVAYRDRPQRGFQTPNVSKQPIVRKDLDWHERLREVNARHKKEYVATDIEYLLQHQDDDTIHERIEKRVWKLARSNEMAKAHRLLDQVHEQMPHALRANMYHPVMTDPNSVERVCQQLTEHKIPMDLETLKRLTEICHGKSRLLVALEEAQFFDSGSNKSSWTTAMYMRIIRAVWPGQAKRYFEAYIVPTQNAGIIREGVESILWKYRVIIDKCGEDERGELYENVRLAKNFYEANADPLKGKAAFYMMDIFRLAKMNQSMLQLAHTQPHPWTAAMFGFLIEAHSHDLKFAMHWFREMVRECPNPGGFVVMLNALADKTESPDTADLVEKVHTTLLDMKETVTPDARTVDALLRCYGKRRNREKVIEITRTYHAPDATAEERILDAGNYQTALHYCKRSPDAMDEILGMIMKTSSVVLAADEQRWTSLLDTLANLKTEEAAKRVHELVVQNTPNSIVAWTTVIKAWGVADVASSGHQIWEVYQALRARETEIKFDGAFFTAVLFYLCHTHNERAFLNACKVLSEMEQGNPLVPVADADHYEPILEALLARSELDRAQKQINDRIKLNFDGTNPAARPQRSSFRQFVGAWARTRKDLRHLTKVLVQWTNLHLQHSKRSQGPDLVAFEMLYVAWFRAKEHKGRVLYMSQLDLIIRGKARYGDDNDESTRCPTSTELRINSKL